MNYEKLQSILFKGAIKTFIIGIFLLFIGLSMLLMPFTSDSFKGSTTGMLIFGGLIFPIGLLLTIKTITKVIGAKTGSHPLLKAIKNGQRDYLHWVYIQQINTTVGNSGPKVGESNNINYVSKDPKYKGDVIILSRKINPNEMIEYLKQEFDIPHFGYSDDTREIMNQYYRRKNL